MKFIDLSIIIVTYNTREITEKCLHSIIDSLRDSSIRYEIIVVDNGSKDGTLETLKEIKDQRSKIKIIENKENVGFGKANNQAVRQAKGRYILLLNSDTVVLDSAIEKLLDYYKKNESSIHFLGAKLLNKDLTPQPSAAYFYTLPVVFGVLFLRGDYWGLTRFSPDTVRRVDWVSGACILTEKNIYEKVGGFDEDIFMYMEEVDLLYRAKRFGYSTYFYPGARLIHYGSLSSAGRTYPILQVYRGLLHFYKTHHSPFKLFLLKMLLKAKALTAYGIGLAAKNSYLIKTYKEAYRLVDST